MGTKIDWNKATRKEEEAGNRASIASESIYASASRYRPVSEAERARRKRYHDETTRRLIAEYMRRKGQYP